jgi:aspartate/glutamate/glutamine transport system permease protein
VGKFDINILFKHWDRFFEGFLNTVQISVIALIGSFVLGALIAVMRISPVKVLNWIGTAFVEFIRNIPLLLVVYFFYLGLPSIGMTMDGFQAGTLGLTVYTASFIAECIRAGIQSIPKGQSEAARATGMTYAQTMLHVVLPQAIKVAIPSIGNQFLNLVKNSSILAVVSGLDLMYYADLINSDTFLPLTVYTLVAAFYLVLTVPLSFGIHYLERRLAKSS